MSEDTIDVGSLADRVSELEGRVGELEAGREPPSLPTPTGVPDAENVVNEGEDLSRTATNPSIDPHQPGVEPDNAPVNSGVNAPATTDPEGDTSKQNAPEVTAPEPDGPNVTTNPGTDSTSDSQTEVPQPSEDIAPGATPQPAADVSEKPLYTSGEGDPVPDGYTASGLQTTDGRVLYHYDGDTAGEPHTGELPVYADEVLPAAAAAPAS